MQVSPIHTDADHDTALARIEVLWGAEPGTPEHDELEVLSVLVTAYEDWRWPVSPPDPIEAIRFHMEQNGLRPKDLGVVLGSSSRASEILNGRRPLTVEMIRALHAQWRIPLAALVGVPAVIRAA
jgi:HTH-type transcriptional regulator / antitoxin HigA